VGRKLLKPNDQPGERRGSGADDAVALCQAGFALAFVVGDLNDGAALIDRALVLNTNLATA
jgi:hypothetical protein